MRKLLIVACSKSKRADANSLPAIHRYDGPVFRLLRRFLQEQPDETLDIYILSAKFGLISSDDLIPNYDERITKTKAHQLQPEVIAEFTAILNAAQYEKLCICVGRDYFLALDQYDILIPSRLAVRIATGSIGKKLAILHDWLYGKPSTLSTKEVITPKGKASLKGVEVVMTPAEVLDVARQALAKGKGNPASYQSWYVLVDDQRVSPKWLVSQLTGLPVSAFHSIAARRMLIQLGIKIYSE